MELNKYMFREYDIRGVWNKDINSEVSYLIGRAFGSKLKRLGKKETLVGYDNRYSSPIIEENVVKGITDSGVDVCRLGLVTTPMYYYGWDLLDIKCGMMITASHNPKDDNGFKFSYNGIHNAYGKSSLELYEMIMNSDFESGSGVVKNIDIVLGTGHAQEKESSSFINKTSFVENCETSAVGRAFFSPFCFEVAAGLAEQLPRSSIAARNNAISDIIPDFLFICILSSF